MSVEKIFKSTCCYCGVGCGVDIHQKNDGSILVKGDADYPVNKGMLCSKGMNLHYTVMDKSDRILKPRMRPSRSMPFQETSWDTALDRVAASFKTFIQKFGPESVGFYVSGQCLTEEYYLWNKLMKGFIGANNIDTNSRLCMSSAVVGYKLSLGEDIVPVCYDDIELSDLILVEGANPAWCHPIIWRRVEAHKAANPDVKIICVDPRKTQTAASADLYLSINPGTDVALNHAIARVLIDNGGIDPHFIDSHTDGFEDFKSLVFQNSVDEYAEECGINAKDIYTLAGWIASSKGFLTMWTMGLNQSVIGVNKNLSLINLSLITGKIGKPGNGPFSLTGQPNAMGGREVGGLANMLASHRELSNQIHRAEMEEFWKGTNISEKPGLTATEMVEALNSGKMKAIWIVCTNPLVSLPNAHLAEKALKNAKLVVVQEISERADTVDFADIVLPAAAWSEKEGTMTNAERRISHLSKISEPPEMCLPDTEIICRFAKKMGWGEHFSYKAPDEIYQEYAKTTAYTNIDISRLNYQIIKEKRSVQWPYLENQQIGTSRIFTNNEFYTQNKKAKIQAVPKENLSEKTSPEFPLVLITGRIRDQWHSMTKTGRVNKLNQHISKPYVEINTKDAIERGIKEDDLVTVENSRGKVRLRAKITDSLKKGNCFIPMHWGKIVGSTFGRANNLTSPLIDSRSKEPDFKYAAVEIQKYRKKKEKIIIVGSGSAAIGFINEYRKQNTDDEIVVFSKEPYPFYNRIMLPDYVNGVLKWEQLVKLSEEEYTKKNIQVNKNTEVSSIDKNSKTLIDKNGKTHSYDKLILCMGSRAFMPKNFPKIPGIFNIRSRKDADDLNNFLKPDYKILVVGGGLLGLEMAAALIDLKYPVNIIQRSSRLMDRQLDNVGSNILHEEMVLRGMDIFYNDEVEQIFYTDKVNKVRLKSGHNLDCDVILVAAGTNPNIELAKEAGIDCKRGVLVNDYLQTSDSDIFACGELAEWKHQMWGITAAAEQQAAIVANYLAGSFSEYYEGSLSLNILKMKDLNLCSLGLVEIPAGQNGYEEIIFLDKAKHFYKKCIIKEDKLVGAILIGDKSEFLEFKNLIEKGIELSEKRLQLLRSGEPQQPVKGRLICSCNNVGEENLLEAIKNGTTNFELLCQKTGAGSGCGSCKPEVKTIFENSPHLLSIINS